MFAKCRMHCLESEVMGTVKGMECCCSEEHVGVGSIHGRSM